MDYWDIFLSYARQDAIRARPLAAALERLGFSVFVDEAGVRDFRSITRLIGTALGNSRLLLAFYSHAYAQRPACQLELTLAYLAGQEEGDPRRRVVVVNPETTSDHVHPIELRDAKHWPATGGRLYELLGAHLGSVGTPIGSVLPLSPPRWLPQPRPRAATQSGNRFADLWRLHSALHPHSAALITGQLHPGTAILRGAAPAELAHAYAMRFGTAYPGGIFWFTAQRYADQVAAVSTALGSPVPHEDVAGNLNQLAVTDQLPSLWVVEHIPPGMKSPELFLAPHPLAATVLITRSSEYDLLGTCMDLTDPSDTLYGMSDLATPAERDRLAAFDLQVELVTRVGVQRLGADGGSLREALSSLRSIFDTTRTVFHGYGPSASAVLKPAEDLLDLLRPFLERWHPRLSAYEHRRPAAESAYDYEHAWDHAVGMRAELSALSDPLRGVVGELAQISGSDLGLSQAR